VVTVVDGLHEGKHVPASPEVCVVTVMIPLPRLKLPGSPVSQTQPVGHGVPPTTQVVVQKPKPVVTL
jgi:hypothetical protein